MTQAQFNPQLFAEWMNTQDNQNPSFDGNMDFLKDDSFLNTLALDPELLAQIAANDATSSLTSSPVVRDYHSCLRKMLMKNINIFWQSVNDYESPMSSPHSSSHLFPGSGTESSDDDSMLNSMPVDFENQVDISPLLSSLSNGSFGYQASATSAFQNSLLPPLPAMVESPSMQPASEQSSPETLSQMAALKRRKGIAAEAVQFFNNGKFVELNEEELLKLDSPQMELYIKAIRAAKSLTTAEDKELKRIRRLIKNREYAQNSRIRKKQVAEEMQSKIGGVQEINNKLQTRINQLELENKTMRVQLAKVSYAINKDPEILERIKAATADAPIFQNNNNTLHVNMIQTPVPIASAQPMPQIATNNPAKRKRTAGTLFIVLFSFALLLSPLSMFPSFSGNFMNPQEVKDVSQHWNTGRRIFSFLPEDSVISHMASYLPQNVQDWFVPDQHEELIPCQMDHDEYGLTTEQEEAYRRATGYKADKTESYQFLNADDEMPSDDDSLNQTTETYNEEDSTETHYDKEL